MAWPTTQVATGELITATQMNALPIALAEITSLVAAYDFTSIPSYWTHLLIIYSLQTASGANTDPLKVTFNGDSAANYLRQRNRASNNTSDPVGVSSSAYIDGGEVPGVAGGSFAVGKIWIPNYAVSGPRKSCDCSGYSGFAMAAGSQFVWANGGYWNNTAAINRVTLTLPAAVVAGSIATLYGMGAI